MGLAFFEHFTIVSSCSHLDQVGVVVIAGRDTMKALRSVYEPKTGTRSFEEKILVYLLRKLPVEIFDQ